MRDEAMREVVIVSAVRTPVGKFQGALSELTAVQLGAIVVSEAVARAGVEPASVEECVMGCVLPAGLGQNPARQAALRGGLDPRVAAMTINKVCGSGLKAVALASQAVQLGEEAVEGRLGAVVARARITEDAAAAFEAAVPGPH